MKAKADTQGRKSLPELVEEVVSRTPAIDVHTHLYDPAFTELLFWGIDELLVYHYLISESFRYLDAPADTFWALSKQQQAELVWQHLFIRHSPVSEACRGTDDAEPAWA
jgi:hypothetical protein